MDLGTVRIINPQSVFIRDEDNYVSFRITKLHLQLVSSSSLSISYENIDNIIIDNNVFTLNLIKGIDTQLGSTSSLNLVALNSQEMMKYIQALGKRNSKITVHSIKDFQPPMSEDSIIESFMDLSISSEYYGSIDTLPSYMLNCNVYISLTLHYIHFHNRREYNFELPYSNISQIDVFTSGLYVYTRKPIYPFGNKAENMLVVYLSEPNSLLVSIKSHI